jgi:hypothetical protein
LGGGEDTRRGGRKGGHPGQGRFILLSLLFVGMGCIITPVLAAESNIYGSISGAMFRDTTSNGLETGISTGTDGWTIELWNADETVLLSTTTTRNGGTYSFIGLSPGTTYVVKEAGKGGWSHLDLSSEKHLVAIPSSEGLEIKHIDFSSAEEQPTPVEPEFPLLAVAVATFIGFGFASTQITRK